MQVERFTIFHFVALARQLYPQLMPHEKFRGMRKEFHQPGKINLATFLFCFAQWLIEKRWRFLTIFLQNHSGRAIVRRITEQFSVRLKISRTEGLQGMSNNEVVDLCFEILRNVIEQLAQQHTWRQRLIVAERLPDV